MELAHSIVSGPDSLSSHTCVLAHGILGAGMNLRSVARALHQQYPQWCFLLPDLRGHGQSPEMPGPHDIPSCGRDLLALEKSLGMSAKVRIGHSFGGKVVLQAQEVSPGVAVLLDTLPGYAADDAKARRWMDRLLDTLAQVPQPLESRDALAFHLNSVSDDPHFVGWMGTNLKRRAGQNGLWWRFQLPVIRELIADYWNRDMSPELYKYAESTFVFYGGRSERFTSSSLQELRDVIGERLREIPNAGHWVHVDNPSDTIALLSGVLGGASEENENARPRVRV